MGKPRTRHGLANEAGKRCGVGVADIPTAPPADLPTCGRNAGRQNGRHVECLDSLYNVRCVSPATAGGRRQIGAPLTGQNKKGLHNAALCNTNAVPRRVASQLLAWVCVEGGSRGLVRGWVVCAWPCVVFHLDRVAIGWVGVASCVGGGASVASGLGCT